MGVILQLSNLRKRYGTCVVLDGATVTVNDGQKIGVIGRNGAGKSTLCKIITGHEEQDGGTISKSAGLRLSYLEQHDPYLPSETVIDFLTRYTGKEEWQCGKVAGRFQLKNDLLQAKIEALSGGYRTRVKLASMLLSDPNFLILDEPTNFLDLKTLILLEEFLSDYRGAFLIVSHDREFLKKTCEQTLEIEDGSCTLYPGSVEEYLVFKEEQEEQIRSYNKNIENQKKQLQSFVDRFRAKATKARQAQSKMRQIKNLKTIEVGHPLQNVRIKIPSVMKKKGLALRCEELAIGYPDKEVAKRISFEIDLGAHVAVLGDNGQGKTTFLRTLADDLQIKGGGFRWGYNLKVAYYAQHVFQTLRPDDSVYLHLSRMAADGVMRQEILNLAGSFLFKGDDVEKPISVLSGGERARVCLAGLLLTKSQVLLLDEPTNHLDFETVEALGRALKTFSGTLFFISHDRTFVNLVASRIAEVKDGRVELYHGNYEEYVYRLETQVRAILRGEDTETGGSKKTVRAKSDYHAKKELESEIRKVKKQIKKSEELLGAYKEEEKSIHDDFMTDPMAWSRERNDRHEELKRLIGKTEEEWLKFEDQLDELTADPPDGSDR